MAGQTLPNVQANLSTDALFRTWGSGISAGMSAAGCVQTADTGQINWTTVSRAVANTAAGYEIWRFNDSLQSTAPVFIKLEWGSGVSQPTPQLWVTTGTGTDGAGTLTGANITGVSGAITLRSTMFAVSGTPVASTGSTYVYGDGSAVASVQWPSIYAGWGGGLFLVERWRNWDGTPSGDGVTVIVGNTNATYYTSNCYLPGVAQNPAPGGSTNVSTFYPSQSSQFTTANVGGTVYPQPLFSGGPRALGPLQYLLWIPLGDYPAGGVSLSHYGSTRSFYSVGLGASNSPGWGSALTSLKLSFLVRVD